MAIVGVKGLSIVSFVGLLCATSGHEQ